MSLFLTSIFLGTLFHFSIQKIFVYYKRFDDINHRSSHNTLATRTGGIGVFSTIFGIAVYQYIIREEIFDFSLLIPLSIMFVVGVYDDLYNADFKLKFLLQIIVAKLLIDQGYVISNFHGLVGVYEVPRLIAQLSTVFIFVLVVNAINFIDGIDGLAITQVIKSIIIIEFLSKTSTPLQSLSSLTIATLIPLYYFNLRKKQKVFLGDAGSLFLGSLVSIYLFYVLSPEYQFKSGFQINKAFFTILVVLYPLVDLLRVFVLRIKSGQSPFKADQRHLHHLIYKLLNNAVFSILGILILEILMISSLITVFL